MRYFEKISFKQISKDIVDDIDLYDSYELPRRSSKSSYGYDFISINDIILHPRDILTKDVALLSSITFKYNIRMCN